MLFGVKATTNLPGKIYWVILLALITVFYQLDYWRFVDQQYNDYWRLDLAARNQPDQRLLMIEIDDKSLAELEPQIGGWSWPRSIYADLIEKLVAAKSTAIVFDILFNERDRNRSGSDEYFAEIASEHKNIFLAATLLSHDQTGSPVLMQKLPVNFVQPLIAGESNDTSAHFLLPWIINQADWNIGLINFLSDSDASSRRYPVVTYHSGWKIQSLPSRVANFVLEKNRKQPTVEFPAVINLKYKGLSAVPYQSISFVDAIRLLEQEQQLELFTNKIVVIGATATGLHDLTETPIDRLYPAASILTTAIDNLLNNDFLVLVDRNYGLILLLIFIAGLIILINNIKSYQTQLLWASGLLVAAFAILYFLSWYLSNLNLLFPAASIFSMLTIALVILMLYQGGLEYLSRRHTLLTFSRFMDPKVVRELISNENWEKQIANKSCQVSVLFSDIRGFTSLSEKRSAEEIMRILNQYFDLQVEAIFETQGTLDKFIGDAIMAFWGAPIEDSEHAQKAVSAALLMVDNLLIFRKTLPVELQDFDVGIGVHSGEAVVGMLGSARRFDYTAIGDTVNLASRIEGATKGVARVLVSQTTKDLCKDAFRFEFRGEFSVKGREEPVRLFEPTRLQKYLK